MMLGIIPARAGSKGIPGKNTRLLGGKPLIEYTFAAAEAAAALDRIWLSTDIPEAVELARRYPRVEVPFRRPAELCSDTASMVAVLAHAIHWMQATEGRVPEAVALLQPTSPFRTAGDIDAGIAEFRRAGVNSLIGVAEPISHPADCVRPVAGTGAFEWVFRPAPADRRQDYGPVRYITGALYISRVSLILQEGRIFDAHSCLLEMNGLNAIDIDAIREWQIAEALLGHSA